MKISIRRKLLVLSLVILSGNAFIGYIIYKTNQKILDSKQCVEHSESVICESGNILSLTKDIETASRGFVVTNDSTFLEPLWTARKTIFISIAALKQLIPDNSAQVLRVDSLNVYIHKRLNFSFQTIEIRSREGLVPAIAFISTRQGKQYTDHVRRIISDIQEEEASLLKQRIETNEDSTIIFNWLLVVMISLMAIFTILLLIATGKYLLQNKEKEKRAAELIIANEELAFQNNEKENRAAELVIANVELAFQNDEKGKRAAELGIANTELTFQNNEKENRAAELIIANEELIYQNEEKGKRAVELTNANRLYSVLSHINQTIVHSKNEQTVFKEACRIAVEYGKLEMAWVGMINTKKTTLNLIESYNVSEDDILFFTNAPYEKNGPVANLLKTGDASVCNDVELDCELFDWKQYAITREIYSFMVLPIRKSGQIIGTFNLYASKKDFFDRQEIELLNEATGDISFALDVLEKETHRKEMEHKVIHSGSRLNQAQAIGHFGSWEHDLSTGRGNWSEEFCRIYGVAPYDNQQSYQSWVSFIHPEDLDHIMKVTKKGADSLSNFAYHHRIIRRNGEIRHIYSQTEYEFDEDGKPTGLHGVAHDITEMKAAESERTKMVNDLVQRNKDLEQFSYIVSHNLRAPVANILGIVDILQTIGLDKMEGKKATDYLAAATRNLDNVIKDINSILELKHNVNEKKELVIFAELLDKIELSLENAIINERASINCDFSEVNGMITLKSYLYSIFFNLISNSIKYRRQNISPIVSIVSSVLDDKIRIIYKDNGMGIDLEQNGKYLFGLYKRFHDHVDGKGMGLYMVKTQVESLGGTISVTSEVNKGTEFRMEFDYN